MLTHREAGHGRWTTEMTRHDGVWEIGCDAEIPDVLRPWLTPDASWSLELIIDFSWVMETEIDTAGVVEDEMELGEAYLVDVGNAKIALPWEVQEELWRLFEDDYVRSDESVVL
jgi:hypothetical protein